MFGFQHKQSDSDKLCTKLDSALFYESYYLALKDYYTFLYSLNPLATSHHLIDANIDLTAPKIVKKLHALYQTFKQLEQNIVDLSPEVGPPKLSLLLKDLDLISDEKPLLSTAIPTLKQFLARAFTSMSMEREADEMPLAINYILGTLSHLLNKPAETCYYLNAVIDSASKAKAPTQFIMHCTLNAVDMLIEQYKKNNAWQKLTAITQKALSVLSRSTEYNNKDHIINYTFLLAQCYFAQGEYEKTILLLQSLKAEQHDDIEHIGRVYLLMGMAAIRQKKYTEAQPYLNLASKQFTTELTEPREELANTYYHQSISHVGLNEFKTAIPYLEKSLAVYHNIVEDKNDDSDSADALLIKKTILHLHYGLAICYYTQGLHTQSTEHILAIIAQRHLSANPATLFHELTDQWFEQLKSSAMKHQFMQFITQVFDKWKSTTEIEIKTFYRHYRIALQALNQVQCDPNKLMSTKINVDKTQQKKIQILYKLFKALEDKKHELQNRGIFCEMTDQLTERNTIWMTIDYALAICLYAQNEQDTAVYLNKVIAYNVDVDSINYTQYQLNAFLLLIEHHKNRHEFSKMNEALEKAIVFIQKLPKKYSKIIPEVMQLELILLLAQGLNRQGRHNDAIKKLSDLLTHDKTITVSHRCDIHLELGISYSNLNEYKTSIEHFDYAIEKLSAIGLSAKLGNAYYHRGYIALCSMDFKTAINHLLQSLAIYQDLQKTSGHTAAPNEEICLSIRFGLAICYFANKNIEQARKELTHIITQLRSATKDPSQKQANHVRAISQQWLRPFANNKIFCEHFKDFYNDLSKSLATNPIPLKGPLVMCENNPSKSLH